MRQIIGLCCFIVEESGGHKTDICSSATSLLGLGLQDFLAKSIRKQVKGNASCDHFHFQAVTTAKIKYL